MRERQSTPSSNPGLLPDPPKSRLVYGDGAPYEEITMSKRKYHMIMSLFWMGWTLFFGLFFAMTFLK